MANATRSNRWAALVSTATLVCVLGATGCTRISGLVAGASSTSTDDQAAVAPVATVGAGFGSPSADATPTAAPARTPAAGNQTVAAHLGSIEQTLSLIGKVAAPQEVPLSFSERLNIKSISVKPGQTVEEGQVLMSADSTAIQSALDSAHTRLDADTAALAQAQAAADAQQRAADRQVAAAQAAQSDRIAGAQANLNVARANLQKVQAGPSPADVQTAQAAVSSAEIAVRKAQADQSKATAGPDPTQMRSVEQELANAQALVSRMQGEVDRLSGSSASSDAPAQQQAAPAGAEDITPAGVSTDSGNPPSNFGFQAIAVDPGRAGTVYVGTSYQGIWRTTDSGRSWSKINTGTNGKALDSGRLWLVALDPSNSQVIYAAPGYGEGGLWKSVDGGVNWTPLFPANSPVSAQLNGSPTPSNLAFDPNNSQHFIASSHFPWGGKFGGSDAGVMETSDGGKTWTLHAPIPNSGAEHEVGLINSNTWLESYSGGVYRTTDAGATWTKVSNQAGEAQSLVVAGGALYLPSPGGVLRSTDNGGSWQVVGPPSATVISDGTTLFAQQAGPGGGHSEPLYSSPVTDGVHWSQYSSQTMCNSTTCNGGGWMALDAASHTIYSSNWNAGVWRLQTLGGSVVAAPAPANSSASTGTSDLASAKQRLQMAKDAADAARTKLQALRTGDGIAVDSAQLGVDGAQAALDSAQARLQQLQSGPNPADVRVAQDAVNQAQAALDRARSAPVVAQGDTTNGDQVASDLGGRQKLIDKDNSDIAKLEDRLTATQVVAPFAGTIVSVAVRVGDTVDETRTVATIARPGDLIVRSVITPSDFDKVNVGQSALIQLAGQADSSATLNGTVTALVANDAGTAKVANIEVTWADSAPKINAVVNVALVLQHKDDVVLIPKSALHTAGARAFVQLLDGSRRRVSDVQVGIIGARDAEITSGLTPGQTVVVGP